MIFIKFLILFQVVFRMEWIISDTFTLNEQKQLDRKCKESEIFMRTQWVSERCKSNYLKIQIEGKMYSVFRQKESNCSSYFKNHSLEVVESDVSYCYTRDCEHVLDVKTLVTSTNTTWGISNTQNSQGIKILRRSSTRYFYLSDLKASTQSATPVRIDVLNLKESKPCEIFTKVTIVKL